MSLSKGRASLHAANNLQSQDQPAFPSVASVFLTGLHEEDNPFSAGCSHAVHEHIGSELSKFREET